MPGLCLQRPSPKPCPTIDFEIEVSKEERWTKKKSTSGKKFTPNLAKGVVVDDGKGGGPELRCHKSSKLCSKAPKKS